MRAGSQTPDGVDEFTVFKLASADGAELWRRALPGSAWDVAVDPAGDVVAGGTNPVAIVVKLASTNGETLWQHELLPPGATSGTVFDLAIDGGGDVFASGEVLGPMLPQSLVVARLSGPSGGEQWQVALGGNLSSATDLALSASGYVALSAVAHDAISGVEFGVLELSGVTGEEHWRRVLNGGNVGAFDDRAQAIAAGADGHIVAVGLLNSSAQSDEYAVVKLRGSDGSDLPRCGDADADDGVGSADVVALRAALAASGPAIIAPDRCSVIGGALDSDILDVAVLVRWRHFSPPGVAGVCQAVLDSP